MRVFKSAWFCRFAQKERIDMAFFVYGFSKSMRDNIKPDEIAGFKKLAKHHLTISEELIEIMLKNEELTEILYED